LIEIHARRQGDDVRRPRDSFTEEWQKALADRVRVRDEEVRAIEILGVSLTQRKSDLACSSKCTKEVVLDDGDEVHAVASTAERRIKRASAANIKRVAVAQKSAASEDREFA
jgi:hypothetical protein